MTLWFSRVSEWMQVSAQGLPRWGWALVVVLLAIEMALGRSTDPRFRSIADSMRAMAGVLLRPVFGRIPVVGATILVILEAMALIPKEQPSDAVLVLSQTKTTPKE